MTRDEQMMNAAEAYAAGLYADKPVSFSTEEDRCVTMNDFCAGWKAADQHPQWIPVEEELPKVSGDYIICEKRGFVKEAHYFELDDLWMLPGGALVSPTHWMPRHSHRKGRRSEI